MSVLDSLLGTTRDDHEPPQATTSLSISTVHDVLGNQRRRLVLDVLADGPTSLGECSELVAARENQLSRQQVGTQQRKRAYVGLKQCHLDKLDGLGIIEWDQRSGDITAGPEYAGVRAIQQAASAYHAGGDA